MNEFTKEERKQIYHICKRLKYEYGYQIIKTKRNWWEYEDDAHNKPAFIYQRNQKDVRRRIVGKGIKLVFVGREFFLPEEEALIHADNIECFIKLNRCSLILPLPKTEAQFKFLVEKLKWLGTPEGYDVAVSYSHTDKWIKNYPENI